MGFSWYRRGCICRRLFFRNLYKSSLAYLPHAGFRSRLGVAHYFPGLNIFDRSLFRKAAEFIFGGNNLCGRKNIAQRNTVLRAYLQYIFGRFFF